MAHGQKSTDRSLLGCSTDTDRLASLDGAQGGQDSGHMKQQVRQAV